MHFDEIVSGWSGNLNDKTGNNLLIHNEELSLN